MWRHYHECLWRTDVQNFMRTTTVGIFGHYQMKNKPWNRKPCSLNPEIQTLRLCGDVVFLSQPMLTVSVVFLKTETCCALGVFKWTKLPQTWMFFFFQKYMGKTNNSFTLPFASEEFSKWTEKCFRQRNVLCAMVLQNWCCGKLHWGNIKLKPTICSYYCRFASFLTQFSSKLSNKTCNLSTLPRSFTKVFRLNFWFFFCHAMLHDQRYPLGNRQKRI